MPPKKLVNDKLFQMRVSGEFLNLLDDWRRAQSPIPSRAEAVRRLVERAALREKTRGK
jgi:hypothetical protein